MSRRSGTTQLSNSETSGGIRSHRQKCLTFVNVNVRFTITKGDHDGNEPR